MTATSKAGAQLRHHMKRKARSGNIREQILREWRGYDEAKSLSEGIHKPSEFLASILKSAGMADGLHEDEVRKTWHELAGDFIAEHTDPLSVANGRLTLKVTQPAMRFHLEQMKPMLLERVQAKLGKDQIRAIQFTLG